MVYATRKTLAKHRFMTAVDNSFAVWNLGLSLFSCWGFWHMARTMLPMAVSGGLQFSICSETSDLVLRFKDAPTALALCLFCFSKIPELGDTVFLILKCKKVRFLQWYHHTTVLLFCWLALATEYTPGFWFAATNYAVHSIMYMYFFLMAFDSFKAVVKVIAPLVTVIQIAQMIFGLFINGYAAVIMYGSYFVLFSQLFLESHRPKSRRAKSEQLSSDAQSVAQKHVVSDTCVNSSDVARL